MGKYPPEGRIYLPTASYFEMSEWALPSDSQQDFEGVVKQFENNASVKRFLRGGFWRNFLTKYAESNNMHKKMLYVSDKLARSKGHKEAAKDLLYAGQCNCAYWHGVFGGLYLPHLRTAIYQNLIKAEAVLMGKDHAPRIVKTDFDCDGRDEIIYESKQQNLYFSPHVGGSIFEWDINAKSVNLLNVLTRRKESYHKRLREFIANPPSQGNGVQTIHDLVKVKEDNLDQYLNYDWYRRASLIDHFIHPGTKIDEFCQMRYGEQGDFVLGEYDCEASAKSINFKRTGKVWVGDKQVGLTLEKSVTPYDNGYKVVYKIQNLEKRAVSVQFAPEFNFAFSCCGDGEKAVLKQADSWVRHDKYFELTVKMNLSSKNEIWTFPLQTVSLSESGFEKTYQGTVAVVLKRLDLKAEASEEFEINVEVEQQ
jgi:alpha-amylase